MPIKPEIRGLYLMATHCFEARQYQSSLQYFTLALRKYVRNRFKHHHHHNLLADPIVLILTLNSCTALCHMENYADSFRLLKATCLSSLDDPCYFLQTVPHQLVPLIVKLVTLAYLDVATVETTALAVKYLQLIRIHYQPFISRHMSSNEAAFIFLTEAKLNSSFCAQESLSAFHSAFRLECRGSRSLIPEISSLVLHYSTESKEAACSLSKDELEKARSLMNPLDFVCFLNILGVSHAVAGRTLLAVEALEKSANMLNSEQISVVITKSVQHRHLRVYMDSCVTNNLSVVYHMLDAKKTYRYHWESLSTHSSAIMEELLQDDCSSNKCLSPVFWALRYACLFNLSAHSSLAGDYKTARRSFGQLYSREVLKLVENCCKTGPACGLSFIPDLYLELLEVLAMLLAAIDKMDESWRTFLVCIDEIPRAADKLKDPAARQNYLASCYTRIIDKIERCQPISQTKSPEFEEIRRLRLQVKDMHSITNNKSAPPPVTGDEHQSQKIAVKNNTEKSSPSAAIEKSNDAESPADTEAVVREFKNALHIDGLPKQNSGRIKKRKKHRTLLQRVLSAMPTRLLKASPYYSSDLNLSLARRKTPTPNITQQQQQQQQQRRIMSAASYLPLSDFRVPTSSSIRSTSQIVPM